MFLESMGAGLQPMQHSFVLDAVVCGSGGETSDPESLILVLQTAPMAEGERDAFSKAILAKRVRITIETARVASEDPCRKGTPQC